MPPLAVFPPDTLLSLVVGVTGHRDLRPQDLPRLETALISSFTDLHHQYPDSSVVLLSSLAEGADRLVSRVALDLGMRLVVPLPLPQALYEVDFETPESLQEFRGLLARAANVIRLPLLDGVTEEQVAQPGHERDLEYAKAGAYIATHSQVFLALWDGVPDHGDKVGGTSQTVRLRLGDMASPTARRRTSLLHTPTVGPVLHLQTPRLSNPSSASLPCTIERILPAGTTQEAFDKTCERINLCNHDARKFDKELARKATASTAGLLNTEGADVPALLDQLSVECRRLIEQYTATDGLALHFRTRALATWIRVSIGVAAAALFFNIHSSFFSPDPTVPGSIIDAVSVMPWFLLAFLASSTFTAAWLYGRAEKGEYQTKYQDYRAIAEALRIQFFWRLAGVADSVTDSYLRKQRSELEWIRSALHSCDVLTDGGAWTEEGMTLPLSERFRLVSSWIEEQRRYYSFKATQEKAKLEKEGRVIAWLLRLSGGLSAFLAVILSLPLLASATSLAAVQRFVPGNWQHGVWMVVIPMFAVVAGLLHGYGQQLGRAEHVRQFGRMSDLFYAAERELRAMLDQQRYETAAELVRELGIEALEQNGDWLILHRERPLEVPPG